MCAWGGICILFGVMGGTCNPELGMMVWVPSGDLRKVLTAEVVFDSPAKLSFALLNVFTEKEMSSSNCTPAPS